jgi:hypothetical protein
LKEYQLSIFDVEQQTFDEDVLDEECEVGGGKVEYWQGKLAEKLAEAFECICLATTRQTARGETVEFLNFIGHHSDLKQVRYWFHFLQNHLYDLATSEWLASDQRDSLKVYRTHYIEAAAEKIGKRLKKQKKRELADPNTGDRGRELVHVKNNQVKKFAKKKYPQMGYVSCSIGTSFDGRDAGAAAGSTMQLRRGVEYRGRSAITHRRGK